MSSRHHDSRKESVQSVHEERYHASSRHVEERSHASSRHEESHHVEERHHASRQERPVEPTRGSEEKHVPSAYEYVASWWPLGGAHASPADATPTQQDSREKRDFHAPGRDHDERSQQHGQQHYPQQHYDGHHYPQQHYDGHHYPQQHYDGHHYPQQHYDGHHYPQQHYDGHHYPQQHYDPRYPSHQQYYQHQQYNQHQQYPHGQYYPHDQHYDQHYHQQHYDAQEGNPYANDMERRMEDELAREAGTAEDTHDPRCRDAYARGDNDRENERAEGQQRYYAGMQYFPEGHSRPQAPRGTQGKAPREVPQTADNNPFVAASELFSALKRDLFGGPQVVKKTVVYEQSGSTTEDKIDLDEDSKRVAPEGTTLAVKGTIAPEEEEGHKQLPRDSEGGEKWVTKRAIVKNEVTEKLKKDVAVRDSRRAADRESRRVEEAKEAKRAPERAVERESKRAAESTFAPAPKEGARPIFKGTGQEMSYLGYVSAKNGKLNDLLYTLDCGLDPETVDSDKKTLLMWAARMGHLDIIRLLIERGAHVDKKTTEEMHTALFWACKFGQTRCAEELIRSGADVNQVDHKQHTPLMYSAAKGYVALARLLLERGADPNAVARASSDKNLVQMKNIDRHFQLGQNVRENLDWTEFSEGITAIQAAARNDSHLVAALLVEFGANVNERDDRGHSAIYWASFFGHIETLHVLAEYAHADLNNPDGEGNSPLMWAIRQDKKEAVEFLLYRGAHVNYGAPNEPSRTPRNWALQYGDRDMVRIIDDHIARQHQRHQAAGGFFAGWY